MASAITAGLVLVGVLVFQASLSDTSNYGKADTVGEDFGVVGDVTWEQNAEGQWVSDTTVKPGPVKLDTRNVFANGDSITFGYTVGYRDLKTMEEIPPVDPRLVVKSWAKLVADQAGYKFELPFYSYTPNNLAVPGYALLDLATPYTKLESQNPLTKLVMGAYYQLFGDQTPIDYALLNKVTAEYIWIGNNDILGAATRCNTLLKTPVDVFKKYYSDMVAKVAADPNRAVLVMTIPDVASIPFLVPADEFAAKVGLPLDKIPAYNEDKTPYLLSSTDYISLAGYGQLSNGKPLLKCSGKTLTCNGQILTDKELFEIREHANAFNEIIISLADKFDNVEVVRIDLAFNDILEKGIVLKGVRYTADYLGGIFSLDGVHPTMLGQAIIANEVIKVLNTKFAAGITPIVLHTVAETEQLKKEALTPPVSIQSEKFENASKVFNKELVQ